MPSSSSPKGHAIVMPFPFGGHAYPLFNLVRKLAYSAPDMLFSFINTRESNATLFSVGGDALVPLQNVRVYDAGDGKSPEHFLESAKGSYESTIGVAERDSGQKVSCLLTDAFMLFACEIAEAMNVKWVALWVPAPYSLSSFIYADVIADLYRENDDEPNSEIRLTAVPGLSAMFLEDIHMKYLLERDDSLMSAMFHSIHHVLPRATALLLNSYEEANPEELVEDLKSKHKRLLHVGCLTVSFEPPSAEDEEDKTGCLSWLNEQKPKTVAYISFGSIANISPEEIHAVAASLEETRTPFLWSLKDDLRAHFPLGFQERTKHQGKTVPWAPQGLVLGHPACGVYVTHCGYNSIFESVVGRVPMICKPIWADNMMNWRMVEEVWGIGMKVDRENGAITDERMAKCLRTVLVEEEGRVMRQKITEFREKVAAAAGEDGSAGRDFGSLLEIIISSESHFNV